MQIEKINDNEADIVTPITETEKRERVNLTELIALKEGWIVEHAQLQNLVIEAEEAINELTLKIQSLKDAGLKEPSKVLEDGLEAVI